MEVLGGWVLEGELVVWGPLALGRCTIRVSLARSPGQELLLEAFQPDFVEAILKGGRLSAAEEPPCSILICLGRWDGGPIL